MTPRENTKLRTAIHAAIQQKNDDDHDEMLGPWSARTEVVRAVLDVIDVAGFVIEPKRPGRRARLANRVPKA